MTAQRRQEIAAKLLDYFIRMKGLYEFEEFFGRANLPRVAKETDLTAEEITDFISTEKQERLKETVDLTAVLTSLDTIRAWESQSRAISNAIGTQGAIIKAYVEANRGKLRTVEVQLERHPHGQLTSMLQFPPTYEAYYYHDGQFYHTVNWQNWKERQEGAPPIVGMIVGERLCALWSNSAFVNCLLGYDSVGGSLPHFAEP